MQLLKTISLSVLLTAAVINPVSYAQVNGQMNATAAEYAETPAKTVTIKHPSAGNLETFFSQSTVYSFEVFKPGDISKIVASFKKESAVESCVVGNVTGDYTQVTVTLKATKNKMWFSDLFKKAGLNTIKINNNPIVAVDKM